MKDFKEDYLGENFFVRELKLLPDFDGHTSANLVYHPTSDSTSHKAILFIPGFIDYFFQKEMAEAFAKQSFHFFALDLRRCGRSLKDGKLNNYINYLEEYFEEIDRSIEIIKSEFGIDRLILKGHSMGGLVASLYVNQDTGNRLSGLILDSPFLGFNLPPLYTKIAIPFISKFIRPFSKLTLPKGSPAKYIFGLHKDNGGEWDFNLNWKPYAKIPMFATWLSAIYKGHKQIHAGLDIKVPILLLHSDKSYRLHSGATRENSDVVLNINHMKKWGPKLGLYYTEVCIEKGIHHLVLSPKDIRENVYNEMFTWLRKNLI